MGIADFLLSLEVQEQIDKLLGEPTKYEIFENA